MKTKTKGTAQQCEHCEELEIAKRKIDGTQAAADAQIGRIVKRDTDIISGLLREIDALHLLLEKQRNDGNGKGEDGCNYIQNCQNVHF